MPTPTLPLLPPFCSTDSSSSSIVLRHCCCCRLLLLNYSSHTSSNSWKGKKMMCQKYRMEKPWHPLIFHCKNNIDGIIGSQTIIPSSSVSSERIINHGKNFFYPLYPQCIRSRAQWNETTEKILLDKGNNFRHSLLAIFHLYHFDLDENAKMPSKLCIRPRKLPIVARKKCLRCV